MPTWLKVILIIVAIFIALLVGAGFIGYQWIESHKGEIEASAKAVRADATQFSQGKDAEACIAEALNRVDRCDGIMCEVKTKLFLDICTEKTGVPAQVCATIPKRTDFIDSAKWALAECARRGRANDQRCTRLVPVLQERCYGK
jgi:hypothetical protein